MTTNLHTAVVTLDGSDVEVTFTDQGAGRTFLLLHGGAGPQSVAGFADLVTDLHPARTLTPVHPGFNGTARPEPLDSIRSLARLYDALLDQLHLTGVTVVGNSVGGWIAAELALLANPRVSGLVLVDAVGLALDDHPIADFFSLTMDQVADLAYYRPEEFRIDVNALPEPARATMAANRETLLTYAGTSMGEASLEARLASVATPTLVVWGAADRIVPVAHGQHYAEAIPGARLDLIETAGHLPQLETPQRLVDDVWEFVRD
ncbi:MAG: alpha/beta hydrolase [Marmoricola sp.]|nr:alpha/beta hydrolase [Marmoricola sp.]